MELGLIARNNFIASTHTSITSNYNEIISSDTANGSKKIFLQLKIII